MCTKQEICSHGGACPVMVQLNRLGYCFWRLTSRRGGQQIRDETLPESHAHSVLGGCGMNVLSCAIMVESMLAWSNPSDSSSMSSSRCACTNQSEEAQKVCYCRHHLHSLFCCNTAHEQTSAKVRQESLCFQTKAPYISTNVPPC